MFVGQQIGPFEIKREIGSGAMGTVYKASYLKEDETTIPVAFKVVALGLLGNDGAMARFEREVTILKQLRHPRIVRLIANGRFKGTPFIAMEYVDGEPLDRALQRKGRLGWQEVIGYGRQLCEALQYAHDKGIIHRDLKPSNLMVTRDGVLKLADFGIAKDTDVTALTGMNSTIGTAAYMSPEQCRGDRNLSPKSDLYSLGVVLYELLTGKKPLEAETTVEMFLKHVNDTPVRPSRLIADLPVWLDNLVMFLMEKNKENRPADAATVGRLLAEVEEKVLAQKSAGLEVATARRIDRPLGDKKFDSGDLDAARSLRGGKGKRRKKRAAPAAGPRWVRVAGIAAAVVGTIGLIYYLLLPPARDKLYAAVERADSLAAKEAAVEKYLRSYDDGDPVTEKVRGVEREVKVTRLERQLQNRFGRNLSGPEEYDEQAYAAAWSALGAEAAGRPKDAEAGWRRVRERFPDAARPPEAVWTWLADKRLKTIRTADELLAGVAKTIGDARLDEVPLKYDPLDPKAVAVRAVLLAAKQYAGHDLGLRQRELGLDDRGRAAEVWKELADKTANDLDQRGWFLLAKREAARFEAAKGTPADREKQARDALNLVRKTWAEVAADTSRRAVQRDCRNVCREIAELYDGDPVNELRLVAKEAKAFFDSMKKPGS